MNGNDPNAFLMGGGVKSAAFPEKQYGTTVGGFIVRDPELRQQTDFDDGKPKFYDNGDPMMQIVVHVQTDLRDPSDPEDDGVRAFYIKAQMLAAVRTAVRAAGGRGMEIGGHLTITYERDEPNSRGRGKDKKIYTARYRLPTTAQAANDVLMGAGATPIQQQSNRGGQFAGNGGGQAAVHNPHYEPAQLRSAPVAGSPELTPEERSTLDRLREKQRQQSFADEPPF